MYNNSSEIHNLCWKHNVTGSRRATSFIQKFFNETFRALVTAGFCLCADAYWETRESGPASWNRHGRNCNHYVLLVGKWEATRKRKTGKLYVCVSAHLDFKLWRDAVYFLCSTSFLLQTRTDQVGTIAIDRCNIRSECFRNGAYTSITGLISRLSTCV